MFTSKAFGVDDSFIILGDDETLNGGRLLCGNNDASPVPRD